MSQHIAKPAPGFNYHKYQEIIESLCDLRDRALQNPFAENAVKNAEIRIAKLQALRAEQEGRAFESVVYPSSLESVLAFDRECVLPQMSEYDDLLECEEAIRICHFWIGLLCRNADLPAEHLKVHELRLADLVKQRERLKGGAE